jgi:membrane protein DedA with SNARE-associated domain
MSVIITAILPYLLLYKYWALFGLTFIAAFFLPIPPGTIIMASAAFSSQGYFNIIWVIVVSILGNIAGDNAGYWVARYYGEPVLSRIGFRKVLHSARYKRIQERVVRQPGFLIFISRFEVSINLVVNLISGLAKVPYRKYLLFESLGEIFQVALYSTIGYVFGSNWQTLSSLIGRTLLIIIILGVGLFVISRKNLRKKN